MYYKFQMYNHFVYVVQYIPVAPIHNQSYSINSIDLKHLFEIGKTNFKQDQISSSHFDIRKVNFSNCFDQRTFQRHLLFILLKNHHNHFQKFRKHSQRYQVGEEEECGGWSVISLVMHSAQMAKWKEKKT